MTAAPKPSELVDRMRRAAVKDYPKPTLAPEASGGEGLEGDGQQEAAAALAPARRVRYTVDLDRPQHRFLKRFALDQEADVSEVLRAVLRLLERDPAFADRVTDELLTATRNA